MGLPDADVGGADGSGAGWTDGCGARAAGACGARAAGAWGSAGRGARPTSGVVGRAGAGAVADAAGRETGRSSSRRGGRGGCSLPLEVTSDRRGASAGCGAWAGAGAGASGAAGASTGAGGSGAGVGAASSATTGSVAAGASAGAAVGASVGSAFAAAFFAGAFAAGSSGWVSRTKPSRSALRRTRSACASTTLEEWLFTPMPRSSQRSRVSLLVSPSSRASSYTRIFAAKCRSAPSSLSRAHGSSSVAHRARWHERCCLLLRRTLLDGRDERLDRRRRYRPPEGPGVGTPIGCDPCTGGGSCAEPGTTAFQATADRQTCILAARDAHQLALGRPAATADAGPDRTAVLSRRTRPRRPRARDR